MSASPHHTLSQIMGSSHEEESKREPEQVAVIDVGTTAIRMTIAELLPDSTVRELDTYQQPVNLGRDVFDGNGNLQPATVERCVTILKKFRKALDQYGITLTGKGKVRAVATTAIREAGNRDYFLDRIYISTGLNVTVIDEAEVTRLNYRSLQPLIESDPKMASRPMAIVEIGAGSTELIVMENQTVLFSHTFRLGGLRLRSGVLGRDRFTRRERELLGHQIARTFSTFEETGLRIKDGALIALGGNMEFVAAQLIPDWKERGTGVISLGEFTRFTDAILDASVDDIVKEYTLSLPDAETLGPALFAYLHLANVFRVQEIVVVQANMRKGMLQEMSDRGNWTEFFVRQILASALDMGRKYDFDEEHAQHVAYLAQELFMALSKQHHMKTKHAILLHVAALLHEVGHFISNRSMHKHSMYLILHSELFGLSKRNLQLTGLIARYHRRAYPKPNHSVYGSLNREERVLVNQLAGILRVANALDRNHTQRVKRLHCHVEKGVFIIAIPNQEDISLIRAALREDGGLFEQVYGLRIELRQDHEDWRRG